MISQDFPLELTGFFPWKNVGVALFVSISTTHVLLVLFYKCMTTAASVAEKSGDITRRSASAANNDQPASTATADGACPHSAHCPAGQPAAQ